MDTHEAGRHTQMGGGVLHKQVGGGGGCKSRWAQGCYIEVGAHLGAAQAGE